MEWQCWVCARACHAAAGHGAGHGGCGSPGGWSGKPRDTKPGLPWRSEVRLQLIPAPATAPGLEEPDGATAPPPRGWVCSSHRAGEQDALCPGRHMTTLLLGTPLVWGLSREATEQEFSGPFFQTQTRKNCSSLLPGFEKSPRAPSMLKPCFQFLLLSLCSK